MNKLFIAVLMATFIASVSAHPGRTNSEGCHNNRKTGDYHCHGGGSARSSHQSTHRTTRMLCTDFDNQDEAQEYFERTRDRRLDRDGDGVACETQFGGSSRVIPPKRAASKSRINTSPAFSAGRVSLLKPSYAFALE